MKHKKSHEMTRGHGVRPRLLPWMIGLALTPSLALADATLPTGGQIMQGVGAITQSGNRVDVLQDSQRMVTHWQTFNVGRDAHVHFNQPNANAIVLNRVLSGNASAIHGRITADGQVALINPAGVFFSGTARVDVGGLIASTQNLSDSDFMSGQFQFSGAGAGAAVINHGQIHVRSGGYVALVGATINNAGEIMAPGGTVALAAADQVRLEISGNSLIGVRLDGETANASITNSGIIGADDGRVILSAKQASGALGAAINQTGVVRANRLTASADGRITIDGGQGTVMLAGETEAKGTQTSLAGGSIDVTGDVVQVSGSVDTSGSGGGGEIYIGGGWQGNDPDITEARVLLVSSDAEIRADAITHGDGGTIALWSSDRTRFDGQISARGAGDSGRGGAVETSSRGALGLWGNVDVSADSGLGGLWLLDPENLFIVADDHSPTPVDLADNTNPDATSNSLTNEYVRASSINSALNSSSTVAITLQAAAKIEVLEQIIKEGSGEATLTFQSGNASTNGSPSIGTILVGAPISSGDNAGSFNLIFDARKEIIINESIAASDTASALNVTFGEITGQGVDGRTIIRDSIATNGGNVTFNTLTELHNANPVTTTIQTPSSARSGNIVFAKDVELRNNNGTPQVTLNAQGSSAGTQGRGGDITFNGNIISAKPDDIDLQPQRLVLLNDGAPNSGSNTNGTITLGTVSGDSIGGTEDAALNRLTITSSKPVTLNAGTINIKSGAGEVIVFDGPNREMHFTGSTTTINVVGTEDGSDNPIFTDYLQDTFDLVAAAAGTQTLNVVSDRSIRIQGSGSTTREIRSLNDEDLNIVLSAFNASAAVGGGIIVDRADLKSSGGHIELRGPTGQAAVGFGGDSDNITDGVHIANSQLLSEGGNIVILGSAPTTADGGAGIRMIGSRSVFDSEGGFISLEGIAPDQASTDSKNGVVLGDGSALVTIRSGNGNISITGDVSGVGDTMGSEVTGGANYTGLTLNIARVSSDQGDILLIGRGGGGDQSFITENHGISLRGQNTRVISDEGDIALIGSSGGKIDPTGSASSYGIFAEGSNMYIGRDENFSAASGDILFEADSMFLVNSSDQRLRVSSSGQLLIRPETASTNIEFGNAGTQPEVDGQKTLYLGEDWFNGSTRSVFLSAPVVTAMRIDETQQTLSIAGNSGGAFKLIVHGVTTAPITFSSDLEILRSNVEAALSDQIGGTSVTSSPSSGLFTVNFGEPVDDLMVADEAAIGFKHVTVGRSDLSGTITVAAASLFRDDLTLLTGDRAAGNTESILIDAPLTVRRQPNNDRGGTLATFVASTSGKGGIEAPGIVTADNLLLSGVGPFNFIAENQINTLSVSVDGSITLFNSGAITVDDVTASYSQRAISLADSELFALDETEVPQSDIRTTGGNGSIILRTTSGNIVLNDGTATGADQAVSANGTGNVLIRAMNGSIESNASVLSGTGHITLKAQNNIDLNGGVGVETATGGTISLDAVTGALTMAGDSNVTATNSSARLAAGGNLTVGNVTATNVSLVSGASIINVTGSTMNVTADKLRVIAQGSIGESNNHLTTSVDTVSALAATGSIFVTEANGVTVDSVAVTVRDFNANASTTEVADALQSDLTTGDDGDIVLVATLGDIVLNDGTATNAGQAVSADGSGSVRLEATAGSLTANAGADILSGSGDITLRAGEGISLGANVDVVTASLGTISINAVGGALTMAGNSNVTASGSSARLAADGNLTVGNVQATNVSLVSGNGAIINAAGSEMNVTATNLRLQAEGAIGASDSHLTTSVDTVSALAATGSIFVTEANGVTVDSVAVTVRDFNANASTTEVADALQSDLTTGDDGDIVLVATLGDIVLNDGTATNAGQAVSADGSGSVRLEATAGSLTANAGADILSGSGDITLRAGEGISLGANVDVVTASLGTISINAVGGALTMAGNSNVTASGSSARLAADGDLTVGNVTASNVSLVSGGAIINAADSIKNVTATNLRLQAQDSIGVAGRHLTTNADTISALASTGSIFVTETNGVTVDSVAVTVRDFDANASTTEVADALQSDLTTGDDGDIVLVATLGDITLKDGHDDDGIAVSANGTGNVLIRAMDGSIESNADILSDTGHLTLRAENNINLNEEVDVVTGAPGTISFNAVTGALTMAGNSSVTASGSSARLAADGDLTVGNVTADDVSLVSGASIINAAGSTMNVTATNLRLQAEGAIGASDRHLTTSVDTISALAATSSLFITETNGLIVGDVAVTVSEMGDSGQVSTVDDSVLSGLKAETAEKMIFVTLDGGDLTQANGSPILVGRLRLDVDGGIELNDADNSIEEMAATTTNSGISFRNQGALKITTLDGISGFDSNSNDIRVWAGGDLRLAEDINAGTANVYIVSDGGGVESLHSGPSGDGPFAKIQANRLGAKARDAILLLGDNEIDVFAGSVTVSGDGLEFVSSGSLTVGDLGTLTVAGIDIGPLAGITTNGGDIDLVLEAAGSDPGMLSLMNAISTGSRSTGNVLLFADGDILMSANGAGVTAKRLTIDEASGGDVRLAHPQNPVSLNAARLFSEGANDVAEFVALDVGGVVQFANRGDLSLPVGVVGNNIWIRAEGDLTVGGGVVAGPGNSPQNVVLAAGGAFRNTLGASAISASSGWVIYDNNPLNDLSRLGGLIPQYRFFSTTYDDLPIPLMPIGGNVYVSTMPLQIPETFFRGLHGSDAALGTGAVARNSAPEGASTALMSQGADRGAIIPGGNYSMPLQPWTGVFGGRLGSMPRPIGGAWVVGSAADNTDGLAAPLSLQLRPNVPFQASLENILGGAELWSANLSDGQALPSWLQIADVDGMRILTGRPPADFSGSLSLGLLVRDVGDGFLKLINIEIDANLGIAQN
ncbi:filamentous hemagglutinin N-terminal domain-containing protein [Ectothiorhodosinus mongolicus]|nr:filamentous hemagglutinin N-terminal domain-containing protein [Ectothiorhodosinus mongolicus]